MASLNKKSISPFEGVTERGAPAARQDPFMQLRRATLACLLWEDSFGQTGDQNAANISRLIPLCDPDDVAMLAIETRNVQKLRHTPLFIMMEMAKHVRMRRLLGRLMPLVIKRADELTEFLALYWKARKIPLAKQIKIGLGDAFRNFNEYNLAKYNRDKEIKLRDVLRMVHPKPADKNQSDLWGRLIRDELAVPDTWEVQLSAGKDKKATWERLIVEKKLGALAFLRNLRNMQEANVDPKIIRLGFANLDGRWLLPMNFFAAVQYAPMYVREIEDAMLRCLATGQKLPGLTVFVVDGSGSMNSRISDKTQWTRFDVACAMAVLAAETCERVHIYLTAGLREHKTVLVPAYRGFGLVDALKQAKAVGGGNGIFTRQALEWIRTQEPAKVDRIMVFSDSQDVDRANPIPNPFGVNNYIVDVSSNARGINYQGRWTAEISGWSEHFLTYVRAFEGIETPAEDDEE